MVKIAVHWHIVISEFYNQQLDELAMRVANYDEDEDDFLQAKMEQKEVEDMLPKMEKAINALNELHTEVTKLWSANSVRILGHITYSPISVGTGTKCFSEDWAIIELDSEKIDWTTFRGNVINLGI